MGKMSAFLELPGESCIAIPPCARCALGTTHSTLGIVYRLFGEKSIESGKKIQIVPK